MTEKLNNTTSTKWSYKTALTDKISASVANFTWILSYYLSYDLSVIVVFQREDGEVKLLKGQSISQRVPHCRITMGQGWIVALWIHAWGKYKDWMSAAVTLKQALMTCVLHEQISLKSFKYIKAKTGVGNHQHDCYAMTECVYKNVIISTDPTPWTFSYFILWYKN